MTQILLSVQPQWAEKILNGTKTIEIRKSVPKDLPCEVFLCVTNGRPFYKTTENEIFYFFDEDTKAKSNNIRGTSYNVMLLNRKVVAKFTLNRVDEYTFYWDTLIVSCNGIQSGFPFKESCLDQEQLDLYSEYGNKTLYAWHIDNLVIFDQPKELSEFGITKAPQSWQRVKGE